MFNLVISTAEVSLDLLQDYEMDFFFMCNMYLLFLVCLSKSNFNLVVVPFRLVALVLSFFSPLLCHSSLNVSVKCKYPHGFGGTGPSTLISNVKENNCM